MPLIAEIAIAIPLNKTFDYLCIDKSPIGVRALVSFSNKKVVGIIIAYKQKSEFEKLKTIIEILDDEPIISTANMVFLSWVSNYYHHPIGEVILGSLPKNLRLGKPANIKKDIGVPSSINDAEFTPNIEQQVAIDAVLAHQHNYHGFLLHGVTGSGKTEVYLRITQELLKQGKQILVLVPEIGLTPQMIERFTTRLKTRVAVVHSQLSASKKLDSYLLAKNNTAGVVLGTRSAIFTELPNLGLIIVDEEHDGSFKQQSGLRYSARDLSFIKAKQAKVPLLLGSATPALETLKNVIDKKLSHLKLTKRTGNATMPKISLIDMRKQMDAALSTTLIKKMRQHLDAGKQVMLFINRRGYAPLYFCTQCDWQALCNGCDTKMIYHRHINRLRCHHCGLEQMPPNSCPDCDQQSLKILGYGTQRLEESLASYFTDVEIIRIDRDTTRTKKSFAAHLKKINSGVPCILVGTQMLAKGHDFVNLAMVGIVDVDMGLLAVDFRAGEHLAQLLIQVSGRAGRGAQQGEVIIQTRYPQHPIFVHILKSSYIPFANDLLKQRYKSLMPPFSYQALLCANAKNKNNAQLFLQEAVDLIISMEIKSVDILGPVPAPLEKKANYYYCNLYLQSSDREVLHKLLYNFYQHVDKLKTKNKVRWFLDVDPIGTS